jgi:nitroreductase
MDGASSEQMFAHLCARSHVAPKRLESPGPNAKELEQIFLAAAQAPDHGRIRPWRFIVVPPHKRAALGQAFEQALKERDAHANPDELEKSNAKAFHAPCLLMTVISHAPSEPQIQLYERLISLGCAIQNMLLMAQSLSFGSGITSGQAMNAQPMVNLFQLSSFEQGVCFIAFGKITSRKPQRPRPDVMSFVSSL